MLLIGRDRVALSCSPAAAAALLPLLALWPNLDLYVATEEVRGGGAIVPSHTLDIA